MGGNKREKGPEEHSRRRNSYFWIGVGALDRDDMSLTARAVGP